MTVISASMGPVSARAVISGPIPRGSPSASASRGRFVFPVLPVLPVPSLRSGQALSVLGANVDVRRLTQPVEIMPDGELLAQLIPDVVLHVLVPDLTLGPAVSHLEHNELLLTARPLHAENRQHCTRVRIRDDLAISFRQLRDRHRLRVAFGRAVMIEPLQRIEGSTGE